MTGTLIIGQATPSLAWAAPAGITAGTPLGAAQLDATVIFDGVPVSGVFIYSPPAGTVLPAGSGQILRVSFIPTDSTDFQVNMLSVPINVLSPSTSTTPTSPTPTPTSTPTPVMVIGEQPVFERKLNKHGKPVGKAVLTGFTLEYNTPLGAAAVTDPANYDLVSITTRKVKKILDRIEHPIRNFTVSYTPANDSVTLDLDGARSSLRTGGQITVLPGVASDSGGELVGATVFTIAPGGKKIEPSSA